MSCLNKKEDFEQTCKELPDLVDLAEFSKPLNLEFETRTYIREEYRRSILYVAYRFNFSNAKHREELAKHEQNNILATPSKKKVRFSLK